MMVAWHETPGNWLDAVRPIRNGLICGAWRYPSSAIKERPVQTVHTVPYGTVSSMPGFQAFHAGLPSFYPSGIRVSPFRRVGVSPDRLFAFPCPNEHNTHVAKRRSALTKETFPTRF
jgi:hypothetical protein